MVLRILLNWLAILVVLALLVVALGGGIGEVELLVALVLFVAIGLWRTRSIRASAVQSR